MANASGAKLRTPLLAMMHTSLDVAAGKSPPISNDASVLSAKVREGLRRPNGWWRASWSWPGLNEE